MQVGYATGIMDFGREALLARTYLWDRLLSAWPPCGHAPSYARATAAITLQLLAASPDDGLAMINAAPGCLASLVQLLDIQKGLRCCRVTPERRRLAHVQVTFL